MFDSIQTAMAYAGGETDAVRKCDPRLFDSDTGQGNRHDVSWAKMQLSLYVIENEAAIAAVPGAIRTTLAVWLSARGHGVYLQSLPASGAPRKRATVGAVRGLHVCARDRHIKPLHTAVARKHCDRS